MYIVETKYSELKRTTLECYHLYSEALESFRVSVHAEGCQWCKIIDVQVSLTIENFERKFDVHL
jgi:hypothetical protein